MWNQYGMTNHMTGIDKVAGLPIVDKRLLCVEKRGLDFLISLGGKREPGEEDIPCLQRESCEEIGCGVQDIIYARTFRGTTPDGVPITLSCYFCRIDGSVRLNPADNIVGVQWIDRDYKKYGIKLAPLLEEQVVPYLMKQGLM